jgi:hypothetical protein
MDRSRRSRDAAPDRTYRSAPRSARNRAAPVTPRRPSFRSTLDTLSQAFVDAVLLAVRRAVVTGLADALDPAPAKALPAAREPRKPVPAARTPRRPKTSPPSVPTRSSGARSVPPTRRQLELPLDPPTYPETVIVDPDAILRASLPADPAVANVYVARTEVVPPDPPAPSARPRRASRRPPLPVAPANEGHQAAPAPQRAPDPVPRAGEEILRATGGGAVLRRRRAPPPSPPTGTEA